MKENLKINISNNMKESINSLLEDIKKINKKVFVYFLDNYLFISFNVTTQEIINNFTYIDGEFIKDIETYNLNDSDLIEDLTKGFY